jgi:dTDP-4-dehydrorhamnose reductase
VTRWLVAGGAGQVGQALSAALGSNAVVADRDVLDITDVASIETALESYAPDVIINVAAWTDVDGAETHEQEAFALNASAAGLLARKARERGAKFAHLSTDYVFDGDSDRPYRTDDVPRPLSVYGASKLAGERAVLEAHPSALVVRSSWIFSATGRNFVTTMSSRADQGLTSGVVDDQYGRPTFAADLAKVLIQLAKADIRGLVHWTNAGTASWYDLARAVYRAVGADPAMVIPTKSADLGRAARRPRFSALELTRGLPCAPPRVWQEALADCMQGSAAKSTQM